MRGLIAALVGTRLLTEIVDGFVARRLGVAAHKLRQLNAGVDTVFMLCGAGRAVCLWPRFLPDNALALGVVLWFEALAYVVSYVKFRKEEALQTVGAKLWALLLRAFLVQLLLTGQAGGLFAACVAVGVLSRLEMVVILCVLRTWTAEVPSLYQVLQLRRGKAIRRYRYLNG
ncbi:CDP-alcohol phosphatidyltransferase family protein [Hymenobacter wooponensis]|uniref:CDP-alcohol phosphatidyltransferase n=1 Tax=Hymenobacter wooponensis TaxID=1525360 RepID=A0A4Z0MJX3_9BACT|nr:CDP-alcohol phosphatidyltransferase family protein [Hymenobacter wooponensis]TGD79650.1 CDP-alcohol phosphatidyltransferase [Hymenobacter wooponensis]